MQNKSGAEQLQEALEKKNASLNAPPLSDPNPEPQKDTGQQHVMLPRVRGAPLRNSDADIYQRPLSYPIAELPAETGVSRSQIYEEIRKGHLVTFKVGGRRYARLEAVIQWMADLEAAANKSVAA